jgi:hypothetical protein
MRGFIRAPQNFISGLALICLAVFAIWAVRKLSQGTFSSMGPAMMPRWVAVAVGICGVILIVQSFLDNGPPLEHWSARGPVFVCLGMLAFAVGMINVGFLLAAPVAMVICGFGSSEVRWKELVLLALALTAFCVALFGYALHQPMPILTLPGLTLEL